MTLPAVEDFETGRPKRARETPALVESDGQVVGR